MHLWTTESVPVTLTTNFVFSEKSVPRPTAQSTVHICYLQPEAFLSDAGRHSSPPAQNCGFWGPFGHTAIGLWPEWQTDGLKTCTALVNSEATQLQCVSVGVGGGGWRAARGRAGPSWGSGEFNMGGSLVSAGTV